MAISRKDGGHGHGGGLCHRSVRHRGVARLPKLPDPTACHLTVY